MRKVFLTLFFALALPLVVKAETWTGVPVVDNSCYAKVKADPDAHTRECAIQCAKSGYGIIAADGAYLKFDEAGNKKTLDLLKKSTKKDHLRATVTGKRNGDTIQVESIKLD